jgi:endogenous inhibitor of DNA gyrase (YacG/DUF329 family)
MCKREVVFEGNPFRPFCSERCKLLDLDNWLSERYQIKVTVTESNGTAGTPPPNASAKENRG